MSDIQSLVNFVADLAGEKKKEAGLRQDERFKQQQSLYNSLSLLAISPSLRLQKRATQERLRQLQLVQAKNKVLSFANPLRFPNKTPRGQTPHFMTHLYSRPPIAS